MNSATTNRTEQECTICRTVKPVTEFDRDSKRHGRLRRRQCRDCINARRRARYAADPTRRRKYDAEVERRYRERHRARTRAAQRRSKYGIDAQEYEALKVAQDGRCAICGVEPDDALQVDHCHDTGAIRGLLCGRCNRGIGLLRDDVTVLAAAVRYLAT